MEILAKGSAVALADGDAIERLRFTAARLAEAAARRPEFEPTRQYADQLAVSLWPRLGYACPTPDEAGIRTVFNDALTAAVTGDKTPDRPTDPAQEEVEKGKHNAAAPTASEPSHRVEAPPVFNAPSDQAVAEPFRFDDCTVTLTVTLLPVSADNGACGGRRAVVGIRTHDSAPSITCRLVRPDSLAEDVAAGIDAAIAQCRADMPLRAAENLRKSAKAAKKTSRRAKDAAVSEPAKPELFQATTA